MRRGIWYWRLHGLLERIRAIIPYVLGREVCVHRQSLSERCGTCEHEAALMDDCPRARIMPHPVYRYYVWQPCCDGPSHELGGTPGAG